MKTYEITQEIQDLFSDALSAEECRNMAIESIFSTKKAIKYGKIMRDSRDKAWGLIYKLYPEIETNGKVYEYRFKTKDVAVRQETVSKSK